MKRHKGRLDLPDGGHLHFEVQGAGPALLLVPGLGGLGGFWEPIIPTLSATHTVVIHDHRGTGQSSIERIVYSVDQMASDVLALMDELALESASLIGHSTGGAIGQIIALDHPQRLEKLILSSTWTRADPYFRRLFEVRKRILLSGGPRHYLESVPLFMSPPKSLRDHPPPDLSDDEATQQIPDPEVVRRRIDAILAFDRRDELGAVQSATLVSCARDDIITPLYYSEELMTLIPDAKSAFVDSGGHYFPATRAELFLDGVVPFLTER